MVGEPAPKNAKFHQSDAPKLTGIGKPEPLWAGSEYLAGGAAVPAQGEAETAEEARARVLARVKEGLSERDRADVLTDVAKEHARLLGMQIVRNLLSRSGLTLEQVNRRTGIGASTISRIATGKCESGPHLWTLLALSKAVGLPVDIRVREE